MNDNTIEKHFEQVIKLSYDIPLEHLIKQLEKERRYFFQQGWFAGREELVNESKRIVEIGEHEVKET